MSENKLGKGESFEKEHSNFSVEPKEDPESREAFLDELEVVGKNAEGLLQEIAEFGGEEKLQSLRKTDSRIENFFAKHEQFKKRLDQVVVVVGGGFLTWMVADGVLDTLRSIDFKIVSLGVALGLLAGISANIQNQMRNKSN